MVFREFQLHIDASLLGFTCASATYATVKYVTAMEGQRVICTVYEIGLGPAAIGEVNNWPALTAQAHEAARHNAKTYWDNQVAKENTLTVQANNNCSHVHPAFESALAPFINH